MLSYSPTKQYLSICSFPEPSLCLSYSNRCVTSSARHYSYRTEEAYLNWIRQYILFHGKRHPAEMGAAEVSQFLTHLAVKRQVAASTQNQALAALLFLYKNVLKEELPWLKNVERAERPARIPLVLTRAEVKRLLTQLGQQNFGSSKLRL